MLYDPDYDIPIESRFWGLITRALAQGIGVEILFSKDARNFDAMRIQMSKIKEDKILFDQMAFLHDARPLYEKASKFLKERKIKEQE